MILTEGTTRQVDCFHQMLPIRDALEVIGGKWKVLILTSVMQGNRRFTDIQHSIPKISPKVLAKELKELQTHQLIARLVQEDYPASIDYVVTDHVQSLKQVMLALQAWGVGHRKHLFGS